MKEHISKLVFAAVFVTVLTLSAQAQTISLSASIGKIKPGTTSKGSIVMSIPKGLHINSNTPTSEFMIPTKVSVTSKTAKIVRVFYPRGINKKFEFSDNPINIYEGKTTVPFTFTVPRTFKNKTVEIRIVVSYQACSEEVCYPPNKAEIVLQGKLN